MIDDQHENINDVSWCYCCCIAFQTSEFMVLGTRRRPVNSKPTTLCPVWPAWIFCSSTVVPLQEGGFGVWTFWSEWSAVSHSMKKLIECEICIRQKKVQTNHYNFNVNILKFERTVTVFLNRCCFTFYCLTVPQPSFLINVWHVAPVGNFRGLSNGFSLRWCRQHI